MTPYYAPVVGGITTYVEGLVEGLKSRGFDVRVWTRFGAPSNGVAAGPRNRLRFILSVRKALRSWQPAVVHAHAHWYCVAAATFQSGRSPATTAFTLHTDLGPPANLLWERYLKRMFARVDVVMAVSVPSLQRFLARFPVIARSEVVYPGIRILRATENESEEIVKRLSLRDSFPRICSVSLMMWPKKVAGLQTLLRSLAIVSQRMPSVSLILVGDGPGRAALERHSEQLGVNRSVRFVGVQGNPAPYLAAADLAVYISTGDTLSQTVLEAALMGKPVIVNHDLAMNFTEDPESAGLFDVGATPEDVANGIERLAADGELRRRYAERAQIFASKKFGWSKTLDAVVRLYGISGSAEANST